MLLIMRSPGGALRGGAAAAAPVLLPAAVLLARPTRAHHRREAAGTLAVQVRALQHPESSVTNVHHAVCFPSPGRRSRQALRLHCSAGSRRT